MLRDPSTNDISSPLPRVVPCWYYSTECSNKATATLYSTLSFNALTFIEGEQCRQHRKRCIRLRGADKCNRCIKRNWECSLQDGITGFIRHYHLDCRESIRGFLHMLRSIQSLENQISTVEMQLQQQPWRQLDSRMTVPNGRESFSNSNWELTIHSSHSRKLTLNVHIQRTEGKLTYCHWTKVIRQTDICEQDSNNWSVRHLAVHKHYLF